MGDLVLIILYAITFICQWTLAKITFTALKPHYPISVLYPYEPFFTLRKIPFIRSFLKRPQRNGRKHFLMERMAYSGAATCIAATCYIFVLQYNYEYETYRDLKSSLISAFVLGIIYGLFLFILKQRASIYVHTVALFLTLMILIPTMTLTWVHQVALIGAIGKIVTILMVDFAFERHPFLRKTALFVLRSLGIVRSQATPTFTQRKPIRKKRRRNGYAVR